MKIRIKGNSLRFRLTQSEVRTLESGEKITEHVSFSLSDQLSISLEPWSLSVFAVSYQKSHLVVNIPLTVLRGWESDQREGLYDTVDNGAEGLKISVEKDFACLKPRQGEDESDNFPNPLEGREKC